MNRNTNSHFSEIPKTTIMRSALDRSCSHKFTGNVGELIPIYVDPDILPGDTVSIDTSKVIRFQTMLTPLMDDIYADFYWFFVPHRLVWDHWINFMGENDQSAWLPATTYSVPEISVPKKGSGSNDYVGSILDYLGYPVEMNTGNPVKISALPVRAYSKICLDWFTNENLTDPVNLYTGDSTVTASPGLTYVDDVPQGGHPFKVAKFKDFWTSMLPSPQKGDAVTFPLISGNLAPVSTVGPSQVPASTISGFGSNNMRWQKCSNVGTTYEPGEGVKDIIGIGSTGATFAGTIADTITYGTAISPMNLVADLSSTVGMVNVNDLRFAFQLQKILELDARAGSKYRETIKSHFQTDIGDARLQRSEYLGGNRIPININQVSNTAQTSTEYLGDLGAYSLTTDYHSDFTKSFVEHGTLMCCMCIRTSHSYCQGLQPFWNRRNRFDFYWPALACIGEQPYKKDGLFLGASGTFGFQEPWADYRYMPNRVSSYMRPYVTGSLGSWNLADDYSSAPSLSDAWIRETVDNVDRSLSVTSAAANQFWADVFFKSRYVRPLPVFSVPGLIDHF